MLEDKYSPRIDLQENGDDNVILGFGVENVSLFQKITVTVGPEQKEVAPQHILLCLTGEGKLAVYYLVRISDPSDLPHATGTSSAISSSPIKEAQVPSSPSIFPFDINDYIVEGETSCSAPDAHQEEHVLSAATRDQLQLMLPYLERDIADLVCNAKRLLDTFLAIKGELNQDLLTILSPVAFIEGQAPKVIQAKQRLADRKVQSTLAVREESTKQEMLRLKELIDGSKNAFFESQERINSLKIERKQLLMKLKEINSLIQLEEANSTQLPKIAEEQKKKMTAKYSELMMIWSQKDKAIVGSVDEDNRLIAEVDAVRLDALNAVREALNL